jgi:hypothetical protein
MLIEFNPSSRHTYTYQSKDFPTITSQVIWTDGLQQRSEAQIDN